MPFGRAALLFATIVALAAISGYALQRELAPAPASAPVSAGASFTGGLALGHDDHTGAQALSAEEEAYAAALWPIHSEVKLAAVRMIFAGLDYKTDHNDARKLKSTVQPLTGSFRSAAQRMRTLQPPDSLKDAHATYLQALDLYASATREMVKVADDGQDEHLIAAQKRSEQASHALLQLSDVLWPGEYKPN